MSTSNDIPEMYEMSGAPAPDISERGDRELEAAETRKEAETRDREPETREEAETWNRRPGKKRRLWELETGEAETRGSGDRGTPETGQVWRDPARPADERVADLLRRMTLEEKIAQLGSIWMGASGDGDGFAPMQDQFFTHDQPPFEELIKNGLGQLTRVFGTRPVSAAAGMSALASLQAKVVATSRLGIPAVAHEECLTGFATWGATIFPTPLAWGASFDPALVRQMAAAFGATMRAVGVHQGLAPVLDVTRDYRWGRTEETIGEDPYLVGSIGTAYVRGLQEAGVHATLKHFAGYSASRAGRNMAPVSMGRREFADVMLVPFEMAIQLGGVHSVMPTYNDIDGVPATGDPALLTTLLRGALRFDGVVVSDYYAVSFLELQHAVAASPGHAAALALAAGLDVELPGTRCFGQPLLDLAAAGEVPQEVIDRAAARVLRQKLDLGLLDPGWSSRAVGSTENAGGDGIINATASGPASGQSAPDLDPPAQRDIASRLAEESVILLANDRGTLPLARTREGRGRRTARRRAASVLRLLLDAKAPRPRTAVRRRKRRGRR